MKGWSPERKVFAKMIVLDENRKKTLFSSDQPCFELLGIIRGLHL